MKESKIVAEWKAEAIAEGRAEGEVEGWRESLLQILQFRFPAEIREDLVGVLKAESDLGKLSGWFKAAVKMNSIEEFRASLGL